MSGKNCLESPTSLFRAAARIPRSVREATSKDLPKRERRRRAEAHIERATRAPRAPRAFYGLNARSECRSSQSRLWQSRVVRFPLLVEAYAVKRRCHPSSKRQTAGMSWTDPVVETRALEVFMENARREHETERSYPIIIIDEHIQSSFRETNN